MAQAKYSRIDNKRSPSGYCSTVTIVVFVALCLVGLWMMTSYSVVPVQNVDESSVNNKNEVKEQSEVKDQASEVTGDAGNSNGQQFEDKQGDLPQDEIKKDSGVVSENNPVVPAKQEIVTDKSPEDTKLVYSDSTERVKPSDSDDGNKKPGFDEDNKKSDSDEGEKKLDSDVSEKKLDSDVSEKKLDSDVSEKKSESSVNILSICYMF